MTFLVSDLYTWIRTAPIRIQQLPGVQKFIFDAIFGIPIQNNLWFNMHDHFFGKWHYTWIRMAPSRIKQLPDVPKFIFDAKFGILTPKNL